MSRRNGYRFAGASAGSFSDAEIFPEAQQSPCAARHHSDFMPESLMTLAHLAASLLNLAVASSGVVEIGT